MTNGGAVAEQKIQRELNYITSRASSSNVGEADVFAGNSRDGARTQRASSIWDSHENTVTNLNASRQGSGPSRSANAILLISQYNDLPFASRESDPLNWWITRKSEGTLVPLLPVIQKFFCIPATSVPSEQLFSKAGELISARRSPLSAANVDMILFLNKNA